MKRWLDYLQPSVDDPPGRRLFRVPDWARGRPAGRFEAFLQRRSDGYDWFIGLRLVVDGTSRAWMQIDDYWSYINVALAPAEGPLRIFGHIRADDVEAVEDWASWTCNELLGPNSPLYPGLWEVRVDERLRWTHAALWPSVFEVSDLDVDVIPSRVASDPESGRVKWWRKVARRGRLPPIVALFCAPLLMFVVIDGHDRLLAASLEKQTPRFVTVSAVRPGHRQVDPPNRERSVAALEEVLARQPDQKTIDGVNRALISLYDDGRFRLGRSTRAWPFRGGFDEWKAQVSALPARDDEEREILDDMQH